MTGVTRPPCRTFYERHRRSRTACDVRRYDAEALLAKYLGGQSGGGWGTRRRAGAAGGGRAGPGAGRCIERVLQTRSRAAILRSLCDIALSNSI